VNDKAIVFFHQGKPSHDYVTSTLSLASERNPDTQIVLLCDDACYNTCRYLESVDFVSLDSHWKEAADFDKAYLHKNTCPRYFNMRSIQRWFAIKSWWTSNFIKYPNIFCPDSDVLIFSDLAKQWPKWAKYDVTLSMLQGAGQSYWNDYPLMVSFCLYISRVYEVPTSEEALRVFRHYDELQKQGKPGGVCDMTLFLNYFTDNAVRWSVGDTSEVVDGSTYDHNFIMAQQYQFDQELQTKVVTWENGMPYCTRTTDEAKILFHTLHLSCNKQRIREFVDKASQY
jgi:hypothetical protein